MPQTPRENHRSNRELTADIDNTLAARLEQYGKRARKLCLRGRYEEAADVYKELWKLKQQTYGERHKSLVPTLEHLAQVLSICGRTGEAREISYRAYCLGSQKGA